LVGPMHEVFIIRKIIIKSSIWVKLFMDFSEVSTVLFDMDGTLVKSIFTNYILPEAYRASSAEHRYTMEEFNELFLSLHRKRLPSVEAYDWDLIFNEMDVNISTLSLFHKYRKKIKLHPDVLPVLDKLFDRFRLAVLTNSFKEFSDLKLKQTGIAHYFEEIFNSDQVGYAKPNPKIFVHALKEMRLKTNNVIYVGDISEMDVPGAKELGIATVIVNRKGKTIPDKMKPTIEIKTLTELLNHLDVNQKFINNS